jgi:hypothetical protein
LGWLEDSTSVATFRRKDVKLAAILIAVIVTLRIAAYQRRSFGMP